MLGVSVSATDVKDNIEIPTHFIVEFGEGKLCVGDGTAGDLITALIVFDTVAIEEGNSVDAKLPTALSSDRRRHESKSGEWRVEDILKDMQMVFYEKIDHPSEVIGIVADTGIETNPVCVELEVDEVVYSN
ncbi:unnamed protein product [Angiostrongylus costaricensis]|uniref:Clan AA aspartic protease n=1 Tax=Angiostrongylus costaricensis TaxID=334426 RepID=A0A0R3PPV8_ANGCS|nr:unnamed protein product [Angiostrongylus costaricensis]